MTTTFIFTLMHTASKYTFAFHPIVWPNYSLHKIEWDTPFIKIFSQIHWFFQIQCFLPVRTAIQQVFNPNNLEFSILIFSDFSLFAIGHFVRSLRPSQWPQWAHQGIKSKLNITAFCNFVSLKKWGQTAHISRTNYF